MKPISFLGNALESLHEFPEDARQDAGHQQARHRDCEESIRRVDAGAQMKKRGDIYESVWDALADTPEQAANMRARGPDASARRADRGHRLEAGRAAEHCGVTQPRINDLLRGRVSRFSLDALVNIATAPGRRVHVELEAV